MCVPVYAAACAAVGACAVLRAVWSVERSPEACPFKTLQLSDRVDAENVGRQGFMARQELFKVRQRSCMVDKQALLPKCSRVSVIECAPERCVSACRLPVSRCPGKDGSLSLKPPALLTIPRTCVLTCPPRPRLPGPPLGAAGQQPVLRARRHAQPALGDHTGGPAAVCECACRTAHIHSGTRKYAATPPSRSMLQHAPTCPACRPSIRPQHCQAMSNQLASLFTHLAPSLPGRLPVHAARGAGLGEAHRGGAVLRAA